MDSDENRGCINCKNQNVDDDNEPCVMCNGESKWEGKESLQLSFSESGPWGKGR